MAALCLTAGFAAGKVVRSPAQVAADADPPPPTVLTSPVVEGTVASAITVRGSVTPGASVSVNATAPTGMDPVITNRPTKVGQSARAGIVLIEVSYRPVIALAGSIPMIRDLSVGMSGEDVTQLQLSLEALGYAVFDSAGVFGSSTAAALTSLYRSVGYDVPTEQVEAERTASDGAATDASATDGTEHAPRDVVVARKSELVFIGGLPGTVSAIGARVGQVASESIITITTAPATVQASVSPSQRASVQVGGSVTLVGTSPQYRSRARIVHVGATIQDASTKAYSVPLTLRPRKPLPEGTLDKGILVRIDVGRTATAGMIVPIAAVYTDADGATAVLKVMGRQVSRVGVRVLETGSGRARVVPTGAHVLAVGDQVRIGDARSP